MDVAQMRMMLSLAECKSMTATAKKLHVTQPALTYQLKVIEGELGFKVFDRTRTGTSLTTQGEFLMGAIGSFLAEYEEALRAARAMSGSGNGLATGSAVIGTVLGDQHDIGKNLVRIALESNDIQVADLGKQVPPEAFVEHVRDHPDCKLVLMSVNRDELRCNAAAVVEALKSAGLRDQVSVMVGGAATSQAFADEIGADAYTATAEDAAEKSREFLSR